MTDFICTHCGKTHRELPAFHADQPYQYWDVPEELRERDVFLTSDRCVIADESYFVRGCLEIPLIDDDSQEFSYGVWVSLSEENFWLWEDKFEVSKRSHIGPFFGWLSTRLPLYAGYAQP